LKLKSGETDAVGQTKTAANAGTRPLAQKKSIQLEINKKNGRQYEQELKVKLQEKGRENIVEQVTLKTKTGVKTRADFLSTDQNGKVYIDEAKSSASASLTKNQAKAFPEIKESGATVTGKGKPPFNGGIKIEPTDVKINRPE
jgi:small nuclear ribonucleoprotein (snRNP)-like protein